jgi:hypothetical protein
MDYYVRKWGGDAGREKFDTPFGDPAFGLRIAAEDRAEPYGPVYDRTDRDLVAV